MEPLLEDLGHINLDGIHWMIVGGESGHGARPMDPAWVLRLRDQCSQNSIPFFFKQWGGVRKGKTGRELEGRTYDEKPPGSNMPMAVAKNDRFEDDRRIGVGICLAFAKSSANAKRKTRHPQSRQTSQHQP